MTRGRVWTVLFSDLFVNLSAGWYGAAVIIPTFSSSPLPIDFMILIINFVLGSMFLLASYIFRIL